MKEKCNCSLRSMSVRDTRATKGGFIRRTRKCEKHNSNPIGTFEISREVLVGMVKEEFVDELKYTTLYERKNGVSETKKELRIKALKTSMDKVVARKVKIETELNFLNNNKL